MSEINKRRKNRKSDLKTDTYKIKTKKMKAKPIDVLISIVLFFASSFLIYTVLKLNVLPSKYLLPIVGVISLITILFSAFMIFNKKNHKTKLAIKIFSIILTILFAITSKYTYSLLGFFNNIENEEYNLTNYSVIVLTDSKYNTIEDLKNENMGYYHNELINAEPSLEHINNLVEVNIFGILEVQELGEKLYSSELDAIVVEDSHKIILEEENEDFTEKTKVIYTFQVRTDVESFAKEVGDITEDTFNIYISGIDTYGEISSVSRSDVNIVVSVNPKTKQILLINIPRDYYVQLNGTSGYKDKLTHAGIYGVEKSLKTIEDLLDIDINYYLKVNFTSVIDIVNVLGGINVYSEEAFEVGSFTYEKGYNDLTGHETLAFVRERHSFAEGDRMRGINQQAVIAGVLKKVSSYSILSKFDSLLGTVENQFKTNADYKTMLELVKEQMKTMSPWNITSYGLNGADRRKFTYSMGSNTPLYVMVPYESSIQEAKDLLNQIKSGEILNAEEEAKLIQHTPISSDYSSLGTNDVKVVSVKNVVEVEETSDDVEPYVENVDIYDE